jgi:hypothetical protein
MHKGARSKMSDVEEIQLQGSAAPTRFAAGSSADGDSNQAFAPQPTSEDDDETVIHAAAVEADQPENLSPEEKEERRQLMRKIQRYRSLFPKELDDISTSGLQTMSLDKLRDLATDVEFLVGTRRSAKAVRGMFIAGLQAGELAGPLVGLELQGLANVAASSEDLLLTVDEVAVKYEKILYVDPVARLALSIAQLALAVDSHNRRVKASPVAVGEPPHPRVVGQSPTYEGPPLTAAKTTRPDNIAAAAEYADL